MDPMQYLAPVVCLLHATTSSDLVLPELFIFPTVKEALVGPKMTLILSKTTKRVSGGFMEATGDMECIMLNTRNGSTKVVHFEGQFEGEGVVLAPFV